MMLTLTITLRGRTKFVPAGFSREVAAWASLLARGLTVTSQCFTKLLSTPVGSEAKKKKQI